MLQSMGRRWVRVVVHGARALVLMPRTLESEKPMTMTGLPSLGSVVSAGDEKVANWPTPTFHLMLNGRVAEVFLTAMIEPLPSQFCVKAK